MSGSGPIDSEKDGKKMKIRKYILCAGIVGLVGMSSGCGQKTDSGATSQAVSEQADTKENAEKLEMQKYSQRGKTYEKE